MPKSAEYGEELLKNLSKELTKELGKGFTVTNLRYMRQFYIVFQKHHALRDELLNDSTAVVNAGDESRGFPTFQLSAFQLIT